jgi:hypothetical protein
MLYIVHLQMSIENIYDDLWAVKYNKWHVNSTRYCWLRSFLFWTDHMWSYFGTHTYTGQQLNHMKLIHHMQKQKYRLPKQTHCQVLYTSKHNEKSKLVERDKLGQSTHCWRTHTHTHSLSLSLSLLHTHDSHHDPNSIVDVCGLPSIFHQFGLLVALASASHFKAMSSLH